MFLRTLIFFIGVYLVLFFLTRSLRAFFRQLGGKKPHSNVPKQEEPPTLQYRKEDVEDADFKDISDNEDSKK